MKRVDEQVLRLLGEFCATQLAIARSGIISKLRRSGR